MNQHAAIRTPDTTGPVFIVGSPRSGTTLFRDILRQDARFLCPEETHFFRWNEPFDSTYYRNILTSNETLLEHRRMDGVNPEDFSKILDSSDDKAELFQNYFHFLLRARQLSETVSFVDKTPQHVYALSLIQACFSNLRVIHLVRNPVDVCASLVLGRQFEQQPLKGALNFWVEAIQLVAEFAKKSADRLLEIRYEDLVAAPDKELDRLYDFLGLPRCAEFDFAHVQSQNDKLRHALSAQQIETISATAHALGYYSEP